MVLRSVQDKSEPVLDSENNSLIDKSSIYHKQVKMEANNG